MNCAEPHADEGEPAWFGEKHPAMAEEMNQKGPPPPALDPEFVALLACPACADRPRLRLDERASRLHCDRCGRIYPILDGIPDLIVDEKSNAPAPAAAES